ncbi:MAG: aminotransferase class I/II-fold pyridoxal phosphate-dependent enzyme [Pseudomonadota bacterium]
MTTTRKARVDALIKGLRTQKAMRNAEPSSRSGSQGANPCPAAFDFASLPEFETYRAMERALARFGLNSPYFKLHDGVPGAEQDINEATRLNFASYDYLGLNGDPRIRGAVETALDRWGISPGASRVVGGERACHRDLEASLARLHGVEDAVAMVSGHATNVTTLRTLLGPEDLVITDALSHNSLVEGATLSGATRLTFPHNDYDWL